MQPRSFDCLNSSSFSVYTHTLKATHRKIQEIAHLSTEGLERTCPPEPTAPHAGIEPMTFLLRGSRHTHTHTHTLTRTQTHAHAHTYTHIPSPTLHVEQPYRSPRHAHDHMTVPGTFSRRSPMPKENKGKC